MAIDVEDTGGTVAKDPDEPSTEHPSTDDTDRALDRLAEKLGYSFEDRSLLVRAMTHRSYANEFETDNDNQRLEYLGDAVLDLIISTELFDHYRNLPEGRLSYLRSRLVREESLARKARDLDLGSCLLLGKGEDLSGGRDKSSLLADAFEALVAAIYLDGGFTAVYETMVAVFGDEPRSIDERSNSGDHKTRLQELVQSNFDDRPKYTIASVEGPPHARVYTAVVAVGGNELGTGEGASKKAAQQDAARAALENLRKK